MHDYNYYLRLVEGAVNNINYPAQPANLYAPIAYTMRQGGKRVRPVLTLMTCEAMGGDPVKAVNVALGIELFHNFTLLHDDVMDRADLRRGQPTVHRKWNDNVAILSGDTMLNMAARAISQVDDDIVRPMVDLFNDTAIKVYEGQQYDMDFEKRNDVTVDEYMKMIRLKTSVLLGCACKAGALVAHTDTENADSIYNMAVNLGLAFQLQDDYLDVWGDPVTFGKEIGGDIVNNKKTFLLINAMRLATGDDADELRHWLNDPYTTRDDKVPAVTALYERLGVRQLAQDAIAEYNARAVESFNRVKISDEDKQAFIDLANRLAGRSK